jgi:hypothetical protein
MIDGFSSYNQIYVLPDDREKTTFTTPLGTFMYDKIPFGLMTVGVTFSEPWTLPLLGRRTGL